MNDTQSDDIEPKWFYRSDRDPLNKNAKNPTWTEFPDSELIENAYSDYLYAISNLPDEIDNYKIYEVSDLDYSIDFDKNIEFLTKDVKKSRLVGRFLGDPLKSLNTLQNSNLKYHLLERKADNLVGINTQTIKSSLILDSNQAFIDYLFLDIIFKITDKSLNEDQAKDDLYIYSIVHITNYEKEKDEQFKELKQFKEDIYKGRIKNNSLIWYTKSSFVYRMINTVLRRQNYVEIFWIRYLINSLRISLENFSKNNHTKRLFRGTIFSKEEFQYLRKFRGNPFLLNGFISTSGDINVAQKFRIDSKKDGFESILLVFEAENHDLNKFASIKNISKFPKEDEYLINMNNFFRISRIELIQSENYNKIYLRFIGFDEVKSHINTKTLDYQRSLQKTLDSNKEIDAFYLAEILRILKKSDQILNLFQNYSIENNDTSAIILDYIGSAYQLKGNYKEAINYYEKSLQITSNSDEKNLSHIANFYCDIGTAYQSLGKFVKAIDYYDKDLKNRLKTVGENHPDTADSYNNIGLVNEDLGNYDEAINFMDKSLKIKLNLLGENHPSTATSYNNIGSVYEKMGNYDEALNYYKKCFTITLNTVGENHPDTASSYNNIGSAYDNLGNYDKAIDNYEKSLNITLKTVGENHPDTATCFNNIGSVHQNQGNFEEAINYFDKSLKIKLETLGENHPSSATSYNNLGMAYESLGNYDTALDYYEKSLKIKLETFGENHPSLATSYNNIGSIHADNGNYEEAILYFEKSLKIKIETVGENHPDTADSYKNIGSIYENLGNSDLALNYYNKSLNISKNSLGADHPDTIRTLKSVNRIKNC
jgi:tetratricopeptide (TPR) repeat protein